MTSMSRLVMCESAYRALVPLVARGATGRERVAWLHGIIEGPAVTVTAVEPTVNTHRCAGSFGIAASDLRQARASGTLVGLFHTHAGDSTPSAADLRLVRESHLLQLIGSPGRPRQAIRLQAFYCGGYGSIDTPRIEVSAP